MTKARAQKGRGWERLGRRHFEAAKELLRRRELFCVAACARFLRPELFSSQTWGFPGPDGSMGALILHNKGTFFPVMISRDPDRLGMPPVLLRFLKKTSVYAVQGLQNDVLTLQGILGELGKQSIDEIDYDLMALNRGPSVETLRAGPPEISIREPELWELDDILPLQKAYELEEVLPRGAVFNAAVCRLNLKRILKEQKILVAELGGQIIAKANTSAVSFTRTQIGGVFVHPSCRGMGIARRICAELASALVNSGRGVNLFVKKRNYSAQMVYRSVGFRPVADYRIAYY
ncbi:MAG: GNAT family N-acetyltransferase [Treponema sp.]|jgi:predicted GNAT family acetyltransferase|nr:GNAT family N-acetyltransferase [Treponema sp.]